MGRLFGTDGVRGVANTELNCETAMQIGRAAAAVLAEGGKKRPLFIIGCDTRISCDMLSSALSAGLCSVGADVLNIGVVPTPAVAYLVIKYKADAGVMISASHNSAEYNGIKIFSGDGFKLPDMLEEQIEDIVLGLRELPELPIGGDVGRVTFKADAVNDYCEHIIKSAPNKLDGINIAIDCANGSASVTAANIFKTLGANVHILNASPDGQNINRACGSTHMEALTQYVIDNKLDAGVAFDGDSDRCLCVDENGACVDGDEIMAICAVDLKERGKLVKDTAVGTIMTNFGFTRFCEANGIRFVATKVGDRFVLEEMLIDGTVLGGEQSGHIIFRDFATTGDGQLTAVQLLSLLCRKKEKLSTLASVMKKCPQTIINLRVSADGKVRYYTDETIKAAVQKVTDELGKTGRIVVRPSGTEPLIRVMVEGDDEVLIQKLAEEVAEVIKTQLA